MVLRVWLCAARSVTSGGNPMSEAEMDLHTIRGLREEAAAEGRAMKALVALRPEDSLALALKRLFRNRCSMAPVLTGPSTGYHPLTPSCALPDLLICCTMAPVLWYMVPRALPIPT